MAAVITLLLVLETIATFNHTYERATVLARKAQIPDFSRCWEQERSQMYFEVTGIRLVSSEVAEVDAQGTRFGLHGKQTASALFVLKKERDDWKVDSLRVFDGCLGPKR